MSSVAFVCGIPQGAAGPESGVETPNLITSCARAIPGANAISATTVRSDAQSTERFDLIATLLDSVLGQGARRTRTIETSIRLVNGGRLSRGRALDLEPGLWHRGPWPVRRPTVRVKGMSHL